MTLSSNQRAESNTSYPGSRGKALHVEQTTIHTQGQSGFGLWEEVLVPWENLHKHENTQEKPPGPERFNNRASHPAASD